jgi:Tfp pilus tip-associated adhesin PilY1
MTGSGERVIIRPQAYSGIIAWASTIPTASDPCSPSGGSNIYAVDFSNGKTVLYTLGNATTAAAYFSLSNSVTNLQFVKGPSGVKLEAGDTKGGVLPVPANLAGVITTRLLNWTDVPTAE